MIPFCGPIPRIPSPALQWERGKRRGVERKQGELTREFFSSRIRLPAALTPLPSSYPWEGEMVGAGGGRAMPAARRILCAPTRGAGAGVGP
jgi:hypothetical protein